MCADNDIKIAGDKPSVDVRRNRRLEAEQSLPDSEKTANAKALGNVAAKLFIDDITAEEPRIRDFELIIQRRLLLSFTATVGFEMFVKSERLRGIAQQSFTEALKAYDAQLYKTSCDTGAFSFYYLAYRREEDIERRIGQTFAMLCSHDGDPIFQELGEALYCWFLSRIRLLCTEHLGE